MFHEICILLFAVAISGQYIYDSNSPPNYCINQKMLCQYQGGIHFACNKSRTFAPAFSSEAAVIEMTPVRIDKILQIHNSLRNVLAAGNLTGGLDDTTFPPAVRMPTLKWSQELADLALLNAYQCINQHDLCHNTEQFMFSGQNLGSSSSNSKYGDPDKLIDNILNTWFNEYNYANASNIAKCCFSYVSNTNKIGHFLTFSVDRSTNVGCAMTRFIKDAYWKTHYLVCNYASASISGFQIYRAGPTGSLCKRGNNPDYDALCHPDEPVDPNSL